MRECQEIVFYELNFIATIALLLRRSVQGFVRY